jgi:hypothetical protein
MTDLEKIYEQIQEQIKIFTDKHEVFMEKGYKNASNDSRKALGEIKKLVTSYRKASIIATKNMTKKSKKSSSND